MKFIRSVTEIEPSTPNGTTIVYMVGYGGRTWQAKRHLKLLSKQGYRLLVMDFVDILRHKNPQNLLDLMTEVENVFKNRQLATQNTLIVGVSLGGLIGLNMLRRFPKLNKLLVVTGGDMTHIPSARSLKKNWKLTREELAQHWQGINIYTPQGSLRDKHIVMILPKRDKVIDPNEVADEIAQLSKFNDIQLVYSKGGHFRTIINETIVSPRKSLKRIKNLEQF